MLKNSEQLSVISYQLSKIGKWKIYCLLFALSCSLLSSACRYDMQDQPRYKAHKQNTDFFRDGKAMRELPEGTIPRGFLREDKAFYQGKSEGAQDVNAAPGAAAAPAMDAAGNTMVTDFTGLVTEFPLPITEDLVNRGEQRYRVFCIVCHGPVGNGDGMIVRRGFSKPPTFNDDRLRNAPVGHFYSVITNGQGKMSSYASQVPPADRWAIVAYIRALQISQNPNGTNEQMNPTNGTGTNAPAMSNQNPAATTNMNGGAR